MFKQNLIIASLLMMVAAFARAQTPFPDHCGTQPLPFSAIQVEHPIDKTCGLQGKPSSPDPSHLQNQVKNNFCGVPAGGAPEAFTPQMLIDLQKNNHIISGQGKEPASRTHLKDLGEGKIVRMKAFLIEAHHADLGNGESVNCNGPNEEDNDIHIALGPESGTQECDSVSAEISSHFRPASWNEIGHFELFNKGTHKFTVNPGVASRLQAHPLRITGQVFFDASHSPCPCGTTCTPVRASGWEIHPIYNIEVCRAGTSCDESDDSQWLAFDAWWKSLVPVKTPKKPHGHTSHEPPATKKPSTQGK